MRAQDLIPMESLESDQPYDPWMEAVVELEQAAQSLDLEPWILERLRHCESELNCNLLLRRDDGSVQTCRALRVDYSGIFGRQCGELRISNNAYLNSTRASAIRNTWSAALFDLGFAGSASAVICDPRELTERELQRLIDEFARSTAAPMSAQVLLPGEGANEYVFGWLARTGNTRSYKLPDPSTDVAAYGVACAIRHMLPRSLTSRPLRVALQGFGPAERSLASYLLKDGASLVAVADNSGGVGDPEGLNFSALLAHVEREELLLGYSDAETVCNADLLETPCDVLLLSASEHQVTALNVERVKARLVVECVPDAVSARAEESLLARNTVVLPYTFVNGVKIASALQQAGGNGNPLPNPRSRAAIRLAVAYALRPLLLSAHSRNISLRAAAQLIALERVAKAMRLQGCGL